MALKVNSGAWTSAQVENQSQRDALRDAFFSQAGVTRQSSLRDVFVSPAARITKTMELLNAAQSPRIDDENLAPIAARAALELAAIGLSIPVLPNIMETKPLGLTALAPEVLKSFFETDAETALDKALF